MSTHLGRMIVEDFLKSSKPCLEAIIKELSRFKGDKIRKVRLFYFKNGQKKELTLDGTHFFLRSSVEYSNPQLTVEEVQGITAARLLEVCGNYFNIYGLHEFDSRDIDEICEKLSKPPLGKIVSYLLNTDDVEPDRYSMNPLKDSIVSSGQSAFPSASVNTERLEIDQKFFHKYEGSLISKDEVELIDHHLRTCNNNYLDMVDGTKYEQLENLSEAFGINLCLYSVRMPLKFLEKEESNGLLHYILRESHANYESIERVYNCMGRSMKKRTTLLTVPHSEKGYGSKRASRGRIYFDGTKLKSVKVTFKTTLLYPNAIDPEDVSVAKADDQFIVQGDRLINYNFSETPSSPQFILYSLGSPEDAVIWHAIGEFGASQLVKSYTSTRVVCARNLMMRELKEKYGITPKIPLQFNIAAKNMWTHPIHDNIDASIGCIQNLKDLAESGIKLERLLSDEYIRKETIF
ncbi:hypothetical protein KAS14_02815 [Candidatus Bathyarchaeota archaeon]|nr:hypothetical protein [Candidatus Bathyarchaeota archaeon]